MPSLVGAVLAFVAGLLALEMAERLAGEPGAGICLVCTVWSPLRQSAACISPDTDG